MKIFIDAVENEPIVFSALYENPSFQDFQTLFHTMDSFLEKQTMLYWIVDLSCMKLSNLSIKYITEAIALSTDGGFNDSRLGGTIFVASHDDKPALKSALTDSFKNYDVKFPYTIFLTLSYSYDHVNWLWKNRLG